MSLEKDWSFQTFGEQCLQRALCEIDRFRNELRSAVQTRTGQIGRGRWLTLLGSSGTGKTYLVRQVFELWNRIDCRYMPVHGVPQSVDGVMRNWPNVMAALRNGEWSERDRISQAPFAVIDEIAPDHASGGFAGSQLFQILNNRVGRWTLLTSNLTLKQIADIDSRIASRIIRDHNVRVEITSKDFALREQPKT